jgi:hypothetical protein
VTDPVYGDGGPLTEAWRSELGVDLGDVDRGRRDVPHASGAAGHPPPSAGRADGRPGAS